MKWCLVDFKIICELVSKETAEACQNSCEQFHTHFGGNRISGTALHYRISLKVRSDRNLRFFSAALCQASFAYTFWFFILFSDLTARSHIIFVWYYKPVQSLFCGQSFLIVSSLNISWNKKNKNKLISESVQDCIMKNFGSWITKCFFVITLVTSAKAAGGENLEN